MTSYHVIAFVKLDEAMRFRDGLIELLLEHPAPKGVVRSIVQPQEEEFKEFQAVFFLDDASFDILSRAGVETRTLKSIPEDAVPPSAKINFGLEGSL